VSTIPSLIQRFEDENEGIRRRTVNLVGNLATRGERKLNGISAHLMGIAQSSFAKPSQQ